MPTAAEHFLKLSISLNRRQMRYNAEMVDVLADSFNAALKKFQTTSDVSEQKVAKDFAIIALLVATSIIGFGWTGLHAGRFIIHRAFAIQVARGVYKKDRITAELIDRLIKMKRKAFTDKLKSSVDPSSMNIGKLGILALLYQNASKDTISYLKTFVRTETTNADLSQHSILSLDKDYFKSDLSKHVNNTFSLLNNHIDNLSKEITEEREAKRVCDELRKSPIFSESISINRDLMKLKYELALFMQLILSSDYLTRNVFSPTTNINKRIPIHTMPSDPNYPKTHSHSTHSIGYNDIGRPSEVRINHLVKELQRIDPSFKFKRSNPFMRSWFYTPDINHDVMKRAEEVLKALIFPDIAA